MDPQVGQLINNKYRLERLIGDGGMGSVFQARHELLGATVALKFLHNALARRKGLVERFLQEAQVSARIKSQHVVSVSDVDRTAEGLAYMVMEYVEGDTLQTLYEKLYQAGERLSYGNGFNYMMQILDGVEAAHKLAIVHRDLKPDNVMLSPGGKGGTLVKILDFGIAKLKASGEVDRGLTRPGVVMGTPEYMAPEQAFSADRVDARADVFSLGVMFFEMLAGRRPVGGDNAHAIAAQYLEGTIAQLTDLVPTLAPELAAAVHKAMAPEPAERFASVESFRKAIERFAPDAPASKSNPAALADTLDHTAGEATPLDTPGPAATPAARATPLHGGAPKTPPGGVPKTLPPEETFSPVAEAGSGPPGTSDEPSASAEEQEPTTNDELESHVAPAHTADEGLSAPPTPDTDADEDYDSQYDDEREPTVAAREQADAIRGATEGALAAEPSEGDLEPGPSPLRAGTEPMAPGALAAVGLGRGTEAIAQQPSPPQEGQADGHEGEANAGPAGSTVVGEAFPGPYGSGTVGAPPPAEAMAPAAGVAAGAPRALAPPAPAVRPAPRKSGASFFSILLIAMLISGVVVAGVYGAHWYQQQETDDDPVPIPTETQAVPTPTPDQPPPLDDIPPPTTTDTVPPPPPPTHRPTAQPTSKPTSPPPTSKPTSPPPPILPTAFPTVIPSVIPGLPPLGLPGLQPTAPRPTTRPTQRRPPILPPRKPTPTATTTTTTTRPKLRFPRTK